MQGWNSPWTPPPLGSDANPEVLPSLHFACILRDWEVVGVEGDWPSWLPLPHQPLPTDYGGTRRCLPPPPPRKTKARPAYSKDFHQMSGVLSPTLHDPPEHHHQERSQSRVSHLREPWGVDQKKKKEKKIQNSPHRNLRTTSFQSQAVSVIRDLQGSPN